MSLALSLARQRLSRLPAAWACSAWRMARQDGHEAERDGEAWATWQRELATLG